MNARAGRSTGEGGGALGSGKPPWGGKGGPILSQDLNRHDGSWSCRHGRRRPASLHFFRRGNSSQGYAGGAGGRCCREAAVAAQRRFYALGGRFTSKRLAFGSQPIPAQSSSGGVFSAPASLTIVASRGSRPARSSSDT